MATKVKGTHKVSVAAAMSGKILPKSKTTKQTVVPQVTNPDTIVSNVNAQGGAYIVVTSHAGESYNYPRNADRKDLRDMGAVGNSYSAFIKHVKANPPIKPRAQMARGADGKMTEQSRKAVADQPKASAAAKAAAPKAGKNKQPSRGSNRAYKLGSRKDESRPDTFRRYMLSTIMAHKDTDSAKAAHAKSKKYPTHKLDFNWAAAQGYIVWSK